MPTKVLVADDSPTIRRRAAATLGEAGFEVTCVEHGQAAWAAMQSGARPDVVLCDILMPELDGYELCERIRGDERLKDLPVVLLRGTFEPWDQERAEAVGADAFIAKPFDPESLVGTLREVLSAVQPAAAPAAAEPAAAAAAPVEIADDGPFASMGLEPEAPPAGNPLDELLGGSASPPPPAAAAAPAAPSAAPSAPSKAPATGGGAVSLDELDDATLDRLAEKLLSRMSSAQVEKIVWEVVPEVAEALVRKRMREIESQLGS